MLHANRKLKNLGDTLVFFIATFLAVPPKNSGKVNGVLAVSTGHLERDAGKPDWPACF
jgi:hypothetical protein